jgi:glutamine synthetase
MNRAALLRVSSFRGGDATIEYRGADPSANPYLLLGALVAAGVDGLDRGLELPAPAEETSVGFDPLGTKRRLTVLPRDLDEALDALLADDVIVDAFTDQLLGRLVDGRRAESEIYRSLVTDWERSRYLDTA